MRRNGALWVAALGLLLIAAQCDIPQTPDGKRACNLQKPGCACWQVVGYDPATQSPIWHWRPPCPPPTPEPPEPSPSPLPSPSASPVPKPSPSPSAEPQPSPSPTAPPAQTSDVAFVRIYPYGGDGFTPGQDDTIRYPGHYLCTATPKSDRMCGGKRGDAEHHTRNLRWYVGSGCDAYPEGCTDVTFGGEVGPVSIGQGSGGESLFNREIVPSGYGTFRLWVRLTEPDGPCVYEPQGSCWHMREITVR